MDASARAFAKAPLPTERNLLARNRVIGRAGNLVVVFGPFGTVPNDRMANESVAVILVGLTPGYSQLAAATQMLRARPQLRGRRRVLAMKCNIAFAGSMRRNLIDMLDALGLHRRLSIVSTRLLFGDQAWRMLPTSALLYPVFRVRDGELENYSGDSAIVREPLLIEMLDGLLAPTLRRVPQALIIPFGKWAEAGVMHLIERGLIEERRVFKGFPHPSGSNGHRKKLFETNRATLRRQLARWFGAP